MYRIISKSPMDGILVESTLYPLKTIPATVGILERANYVTLAILPEVSPIDLQDIEEAANLHHASRSHPELGTDLDSTDPTTINPGDRVRITKDSFSWAEGRVISADQMGSSEPGASDWYIELSADAGTITQGYIYWKQAIDGGSVEVLSRAEPRPPYQPPAGSGTDQEPTQKGE
jgi:hypothetical protein